MNTALQQQPVYAEPEVAEFAFPLYDGDPMQFVDFTGLAFSYATTPAELDVVLCAMLRVEVLDYMESYPAALSIVAPLVIDAARRTCFALDQEYVPTSLFMLPRLFKDMGWKLELTDDWSWQYQRLLRSTDGKNADDSTYWASQVKLLFIDGVFHSFETAINKLVARTQDAEPRHKVASNLVRLGMLMGHSAWAFPAGEEI